MIVIKRKSFKEYLKEDLSTFIEKNIVNLENSEEKEFFINELIKHLLTYYEIH